MIVALEGIDAAGKLTITQLLKAYFMRDETMSSITRVKTHDFPHYQTIAGGVVGRILLGETIVVPKREVVDLARKETPHPDDFANALAKQWSDDKARIIQSMMIIDRLEHLSMLVEFANSRNNLLILDRFKMSGLAYGIADGLDPNWISLCQSVIPDADINVLLDISVEESLRRRPERRDYYETNFNMLQEVRSNYLTLFAEMQMEADGESQPEELYLVVNGHQTPDQITKQIVAAIWKHMSQMTTSFDTLETS